MSVHQCHKNFAGKALYVTDLLSVTDFAFSIFVLACLCLQQLESSVVQDSVGAQVHADVQPMPIIRD